MNRLNYFNPYISKDGSHEDQLTRAYLVLLKHSGHALFMFFENCRTNHDPKDGESPLSILDLLDEEWIIETQKVNPVISTANLLSVLISDSTYMSDKTVIGVSERNARYDGIISFGNKLTIIIENKPRSENIWFDQLMPSKHNLSEETQVYINSSRLAWKDIIKQLNHLLLLPSITGYEKIMIDDFLSFVDDRFAYLNPFDNFSQCKHNKELLERRISNILKL
ncbi:MAG: hypothetical protein IPK08_15830 [Bacteroidetes bacterium]|nr:hypothetical protein [Bacteroidota bacterium]